MKNIQINQSSIGQQDYDLVEMIEESKDIMIYQKRPPYQVISPSESVATDYAFYNGKEVVIVRNDESLDLTEIPESWTPIGIVVVPGTHDVYGDGSCGVMSLKPMNCSTPTTGGTSEQLIDWGDYGTDISSLPNSSELPVGNTENGIPTGQAGYSSLPSDKFDDYQCLHDTDVYYHYDESNRSPSPYLTDGSRNPGYYQTTSPSSSNNGFADFDGKGNTDKIIAQRGTKDYSSWKPGSNTTETDYPAASCCDMFYTDGTQQGDWYLPAMGELGYIMPPLSRINEAIAKILNAYGSSVGIALDTKLHGYWSSSENDKYDAYRVSLITGSVGGNVKHYGNYVRAWLRVK